MKEAVTGGGCRDFTSLLLSPLLTSHSAMFKVNIFTASLITRTSETGPRPRREFKYSSSLSSSRCYSVCLTPTGCHFQLCHSHSCCLRPCCSRFTSPCLSSCIPLRPYARRAPFRGKRRQHMCVMFGSHFTCS